MFFSLLKLLSHLFFLWLPRAEHLPFTSPDSTDKAKMWYIFKKFIIGEIKMMINRQNRVQEHCSRKCDIRVIGLMYINHSRGYQVVRCIWMLCTLLHNNGRMIRITKLVDLLSLDKADLMTLFTQRRLLPAHQRAFTYTIVAPKRRRNDEKVTSVLAWKVWLICRYIFRKPTRPRQGFLNFAATC